MRPLLTLLVPLLLLSACREPARPYEEVDVQVARKQMERFDRLPDADADPDKPPVRKPWEPADALGAQQYLVVQAEIDCIRNWWKTDPKKAEEVVQKVFERYGVTPDRLEEIGKLAAADDKKAAAMKDLGEHERAKACPEGRPLAIYLEAAEGEAPAAAPPSGAAPKEPAEGEAPQ